MSSPTHDSGQLVEELLGRWFDAIEAGEPISLDDLCAEHPELRPRIERLVELESEVLGHHASPENRGGPRPVPAERIGDFVLHRWIGGGGMGDVYVATQEPLGRPVALKVLRQHLAGSPTRRERFRREARITASLEHPNIVPVFEAGEADGFLFLAMRLLKGQTLSERTTPWKPRELAAAVLPVARALQVAQ
ncbi:MAG: protein kinase [Planctomycetota bacterium]